MKTVSPKAQKEVEPHSVEAEQMILGAILLGCSCGPVESAGGADIFFEPVHAEIYRVCRNLEKADKLVSPVTVKASISEELKERMEPLGGVGYLAKLAGYSISPSQIGEYAEIVAEASAKRQLLEIMRDAKDGIADGDLSASDVAAQMEARFQTLTAAESRVKPISMMLAVEGALKEIHAAYSGEERRCVMSGINSLDRFVPGFAPGEMWLLGGRPSMGKTAIALFIGLNAARSGHPVVIASLEMTPEAMAMRALSEATGGTSSAVSYANLRSGNFSEKQRDALEKATHEVAYLPITFLPREYQDTSLLQVGVKQALRRMNGDKLPLVIVDYAQLLRSKAATRYEQITDVSLALKGMAMGLIIPVIALSQLSRALEQRDDKRPMLSDLRESGQLEQDADGVLFCYRDEYYLERDEPDPKDHEAHSAWEKALAYQRNRLEIIIAKQRQGAIGTAKLHFNPALNLIWE
ncbi:replicative DNA helicase [Roseovarius aestuariivivens]|uniref:replicative DNA helicase n=1 Tax=Roseovarius aestuariivivens TaxID=1888910 RepID=UPI001081D122|nr:DnaB-like helicase C-terminal domain-containing protein [Roseovarius aestuariivivens]